MFQLTVKSGTNKGSSWQLSDAMLTIGRSPQCDIVIPDAIVSRHHCELWAENGTAYIRDAGSSNATLVNGQPVDERALALGDEIAIGPYAFIFSVVTGDTVPVEETRPDVKTPLTVSLSNVTFLREESPDTEDTWMPSSVYEFRDLFLLNRAFSRAASTDALLQAAVDALQSRFKPAGIWYASVLGSSSALLPHELEYTGAVQESAPVDVMQQAVGERSGVLVTNYLRKQRPAALETIAAAPATVGDRVFGVLAMRGVTPGRAYDEQDLQYLLAVADSLAPHIAAMGQREQMRRDLNGLTRRSGAAAGLVGENETLRQVLDLSARAAASDLPILILGETGVGKELIARRIHDLSERADRPFVTVNCASIPRELCESELFGHEKGSFTGATQRRVGRFEEAHTGTLFLDEIGDLPLDAQVSILRAVELGTFHRIGNSREHKVNVRIVAATNRPLADDVANGSFRADLFHRLCGLEILVPPLRERKADIPPLAEFFMAQAGASRGNELRGISDGAMKTLLAWDWPGNVRELRLCIERAVVLSRSPEIQAEDLVMRGSGGAVLEHSTPRDEAAPTTMADAEKQHITRVLDQNGGNIRATARALEISRATLYAKLKAYGIDA